MVKWATCYYPKSVARMMFRRRMLHYKNKESAKSTAAEESIRSRAKLPTHPSEYGEIHADDRRRVITAETILDLAGDKDAETSHVLDTVQEECGAVLDTLDISSGLITTESAAPVERQDNALDDIEAEMDKDLEFLFSGTNAEVPTEEAVFAGAENASNATTGIKDHSVTEWPDLEQDTLPDILDERVPIPKRRCIQAHIQDEGSLIDADSVTELTALNSLDGSMMQEGILGLSHESEESENRQRQDIRIGCDGSPAAVVPQACPNPEEIALLRIQADINANKSHESICDTTVDYQIDVSEESVHLPDLFSRFVATLNDKDMQDLVKCQDFKDRMLGSKVFRAFLAEVKVLFEQKNALIDTYRRQMAQMLEKARTIGTYDLDLRIRRLNEKAVELLQREGSAQADSGKFANGMELLSQELREAHAAQTALLDVSKGLSSENEQNRQYCLRMVSSTIASVTYLKERMTEIYDNVSSAQVLTDRFLSRNTKVLAHGICLIKEKMGAITKDLEAIRDCFRRGLSDFMSAVFEERAKYEDSLYKLETTITELTMTVKDLEKQNDGHAHGYETVCESNKDLLASLNIKSMYIKDLETQLDEALKMNKFYENQLLESDSVVKSLKEANARATLEISQELGKIRKAHCKENALLKLRIEELEFELGGGNLP